MSRLALCVPAALALVAFQSVTPSTPTPAYAWFVCTGNSERPSGSLARVELNSGAVERVLDMRSGVTGEHEPVELALLPDGRGALVAQVVNVGSPHCATVIETVSLADGSAAGAARFDGWLDALEFHPASGALWAAQVDQRGERWLVRVDLAKSQLERVGSLPSELAPRSLAFDKNGKRLWCLSATNVAATDEVLELDPANGKVLRRVRWGFDQPALALEIDVSGRFIALAWGGVALEFDPRSGSCKSMFALDDVRFTVPTGLELEPPTPKHAK